MATVKYSVSRETVRYQTDGTTPIDSVWVATLDNGSVPVYGTFAYDAVEATAQASFQTTIAALYPSDTVVYDDWNYSDMTGAMWALDGVGGGPYENALGNPGTDGYLLSSTTAGVRSWVAPSGGGGTFSGCKLYPNVATSIAHATETIVTWEGEVYDTDAYHPLTGATAAKQKMTVPTTGYYMIIIHTDWDYSSAGHRTVMYLPSSDGYIRQLGAEPVHQSTGMVHSYTYSDVISLTAGNYITVRVYQNSGAALTLFSGVNATWVSLTRLG